MKGIPISALLGLAVTALFFATAIFAPWIAPYGMSQIVGGVWDPASAQHWLGTDNLGRDLLTRMIYGARNTIFVASAATALSFCLGAFLGFTAAVYGGWVDQILARSNDLVMSIPTLISALVVLSVMPVTLPVLILVMGLLDSTRVFRLSRAVAVDIGGTWTRAALFHGWKLVESWRISTSEVVDRRAWILEQTCDVGVDTVAISSGGTVDPVALEVVEANEIIPGTYVGTTFVLPDANVVALNDGLATAWGHACLPQYAGRRVATLTLGTGLGFGFVANGQIHMGDRGEYARLNDLAGPSGPSFEEVLAGNQRFPPEVRREAAQRAVAAIRNLFFPDAIVLSGGVGLHEDLGLELPSSPFGEDAGLYGAAALALFPPANLPRATRGSL